MFQTEIIDIISNVDVVCSYAQPISDKRMPLSKKKKYFFTGTKNKPQWKCSVQAYHTARRKKERH
jgi:hypothetical protein